jgi:hypothetical protein
VQDTLAFYNAQTGCWPNRDPIDKLGRRNLYAFILNDPCNKLDPDGRDTWVPYPYPGHYVSDPKPPPYPPPTPFPQKFLKKYDCSCCGEDEVNNGLNELQNRFNAAKRYVDDRGLQIDADRNSPGRASCYKSNDAILSFMDPTPHCWICYMDRRWQHLGGLVGYDENFIHCYTRNNKEIKKEVIFDWFDSALYGGSGVYADVNSYSKRYPYQAEQYPSMPVYSDCSKPDKEWKPDNSKLDALFIFHDDN